LNHFQETKNGLIVKGNDQTAIIFEGIATAFDKNGPIFKSSAAQESEFPAVH
jgi:hypothetical protein